MPRVIRKLDIAERPTFDEQLWPINALLVVLSAAVAGMIIGTSEFTSELNWHNGWLRLATLVVTVGLLVALAWWFRGSIGRRFQLGAAASLLAHAVIAILLYFQHLDLFQPVPSAAPRDTVPVLVRYEYQVRAPDDQAPQEAHERPVNTPTPEDRPIELTRTPTAEPRIDEPQPLPIPQTDPAVEPTQVQMRRNELAAPRRANQESLRSRSTTQTAAQPSELVSAPEQRITVEQTPSLQASATAVARTESTQATQTRTAEMAAAIEVSRNTAQPVRREQQEPNEPAPSTPAAAIARATAAPAEVPRAAADAPTAVARTENIQQPEASNVATLARATSSPPARAEVEQPTMRSNTPVAVASQSRPAPDSQPTVTASTENAPSRDVSQSAAVSAPAVEAPAAVASNSSDASRSTQSGPAPTELARGAVSAPARGAIESNSPSSPAVSDISQPSIARRQEPGNPGVISASRATSVPSRAVATSNNAASPVNLENPSPATAGDASSARSQSPAATSLTRSTAGETGIGQSPNFDRGISAPATSVQVASAAAQRARSTIDSGAAPAASSPSALRRSQAQAQIDSATAVAQDAAPADYRAGAVPTQLDATSGAAVARSASAAPRGSIAAEAGNLPTDTGAARIVSRAGVARSDGGGQPNVAAVANPGQPGRATTTGDAVAAVASEALAPSAAAPTTSGVPAAGLSAQATGAARSASAASARQPSDIGGGAPASSPATAVASAGAPSRSELSTPAAAAGTTSGPVRSASSTQVADAGAQDVQVASAARPAGQPAGARLDATSLSGNRDAAGLSGRTTPSPVGGAPAESSTVAFASGPSGIATSAAARGLPGDQPTVNDASATAPLARQARATGEAAAEGAIDVPDVANNASAPVAATRGDALPGPSTGPSAVARRATGGVPVQIASVAGPGGLASELSAVVGSRKTSAQRESELIHDADTRFLGREISGAVPAPSFIRDAAKAFERRGRDTGTGQGQQGAKTEEAIERGLEFLARSQQEDGSWSFQKFPGATDDDTGMIHSDTAATGLALMAFLGGGYDHFEDKHRDTVRRGLHYLLRQQTDNGDLYVAQEPESHKSAWLYSHAIASIALTEALGMTGDQELRGPAQRALDFIEAAQDRQFGGWRYEPGVASDTSVAGWQLMALKSGELAGLQVKRETYDAARKWLDRAQMRNDGSQYLYNPTKPNTQYPTDQRRPTMTSVGLLMRLYLGWDRTRPEFRRGAEHILRYPAAYGTSSSPMRDTYYWYYATQFMFHMRGDYWQRWNNTLYPLLTGSQITQGALSGSWHPGGNIADRWGPQGGRIYVTTLNLLSLEVYYRHLPIYEETGK